LRLATIRSVDAPQIKVMNLNKPTMLNRVAKQLAPTLSRIALAGPLAETTRMLEAYLAFLQGKGAGTGWALDAEIDVAVRTIRRRGATVFDVGANVGAWSAGLLARRPDVEIHLFEPLPACQEAIRRRQLQHATVVPCAVGARKGEGTLHFFSPTFGAASLNARRDTFLPKTAPSTLTVPIISLDDYVTELHVEFVDYVKIDVEGAELEVLKGAGGMLQRHAIGALSFEFGSGQVNSRTFFRDIWDLLVENDFRISRITPAGRALPITEYYEDLEYYRGVSNYLAVLKSPPDYNGHPCVRR
jgi:FkbM family methyltransferase